jgi:hypothetical protein
MQEVVENEVKGKGHVDVLWTRSLVGAKRVVWKQACLPKRVSTITTYMDTTNNPIMELYAFGFNGCFQLQPDPLIRNISTPVCVLQAKAIRVLWASWCDAVIAHQNTSGHWTLQYTGNGLTAAQKDHIFDSKDLKDATNADLREVRFFGTVMHDGLQGYVLHSNGACEYEVVIFATDQDIEQGVSEIQKYELEDEIESLAISIGSGGGIFVSMSLYSDDERLILHLKDLQELRGLLTTGSLTSSANYQRRLASFYPKQLCSDSTTETTLAMGSVYTSASDPRYPRCLGRSYEGTANFKVVPYLSEMNITKIASGGYMTAAISAEGELFLWGQACPGSADELAVLKAGVHSDGGEKGSNWHGISVEEDQDEFVKCLKVRIKGEEARVYDVAVGHGHILVAAQAQVVGTPLRRAVFAAGDCSRGQLGITTVHDFVEDFVEVSELRGRNIEQLVVAGWSSFIVTKGD